MKGGIVAFLYAILALDAAGYDTRPLKVILAGDEEIAHANSDAAEHFMQEARGCAAAFNCETGFVDNGIVGRPQRHRGVCPGSEGRLCSCRQRTAERTKRDFGNRS